MLEFTSDHGVVRFPGDAQLEEPDLVRFRVRDVPEIEQRREYVRVRAPRPVVIAVSGSGTIDSAYSVDVSGGGMLLSGPETLQLDDNIRFRLHLDSTSPPIKGGDASSGWPARSSARSCSSRSPGRTASA